jgi:hypothetical protein
MNRWLALLTIAYHSDYWRPIVASLLVATGFALAAMTFGPVGF